LPKFLAGEVVMTWLSSVKVADCPHTLPGIGNKEIAKPALSSALVVKVFLS